MAADIQAFVTKVWVKKNWLVKLMRWSKTKEELEEFRAKMTNVTNLIQTGASIGTFAFLQTIQTEKDKLDQDIKGLQSKFNCTSVQELVKIPEACKELAGGYGCRGTVLEPNDPLSTHKPACLVACHVAIPFHMHLVSNSPNVQ